MNSLESQNQWMAINRVVNRAIRLYDGEIRIKPLLFQHLKKNYVLRAIQLRILHYLNQIKNQKMVIIINVTIVGSHVNGMLKRKRIPRESILKLIEIKFEKNIDVKVLK